jgi:hypothetical protein
MIEIPNSREFQCRNIEPWFIGGAVKRHEAGVVRACGAVLHAKNRALARQYDSTNVMGDR